MRQQVARLIPTLLVGGCSLIYNPSNIGKAPPDATDAQGIDAEMTADARIDAPPLADANPGALVLEDVAPNVIYEGQGKGGSRAALLVIRGHHIIPAGLTVAITPSTGLTLGTPMVSMNGDFIAVPVTAEIVAASSGSTPLTITVDQTGGPAGGVSLTGKLALNLLPEFPAGTTIATSSLAPLYSQVDTNSNVTFTGGPTQPALVRSVSSIKIGNITVNGAAGGTGASFGAGGAGGCAGGAVAATGGCTQNDGGGGGTSMASGGGGGGFGAAGGTGNGVGGGAAGVQHGNVQVVNYGGAAGNVNQSGGGGGGGAASLSNAGAGGGGGGTLELTAGGTITVGTISANGGTGGNATTLITGAGGGGGGSGGLVVLRSEAASVTATAITATGGAAGTGAGTGGGGGMGGPGRVRIDVVDGAVPSATPASRRGPSFATSSVIVTTDNPMLQLLGTTDDVVDAYVIDADDLPHFGEPMNVKFVNGALMMKPTLLPGYNKLCVTLRPGTRGDSLADTCIEMAYLP